MTDVIYTLIDPIFTNVRYIGRAKNFKVRLSQHYQDATKEWEDPGYQEGLRFSWTPTINKKTWLGFLVRCGYNPIIEIKNVEKDPIREESDSIWNAVHQGLLLVNCAPPPCFSGNAGKFGWRGINGRGLSHFEGYPQDPYFDRWDIISEVLIKETVTYSYSFGEEEREVMRVKTPCEKVFDLLPKLDRKELDRVIELVEEYRKTAS